MISTTATIGTEIAVTPGTWTGKPTLTYQWQRYTGGAWADIIGATDTAYTPVDADFGYSLRVVETPNGNAALAVYSEATGLTAEAPAQTNYVEQIVNGSMEDGDPPTGYTVIDATIAAEAEERPGGAGSKSLRVIRAGNQFGRFRQTLTIGLGERAEFSGWQRNINASSGIRVNVAYQSGGAPWCGPGTWLTGTSWVRRRGLAIRTNTDTIIAAGYLNASEDGQAALADDLSLRTFEPNTQLAAPSADMRITQWLTLPETPDEGTQVWLLTRIDSDGNWWSTVLEYTGSQWNVTTYSVVNHSRTSRITAANVGAVTGLRINMNADSISLYTTANGTDWTQRGNTISNSAYQDKTGVNVLATSDVTLGALEYAPAD